jgi:DNA-binding LytR/AlgR family response regulator
MKSKSDEPNNGHRVAASSSLDRQVGGLALDSGNGGASADASSAMNSGPEIDLADSPRSFHAFEEQSARPVGQRFAIKTGRRLVFLDSHEIDWVEACGNYVRFRVGGESYLVRAGIGQIAQRLNPAEFVRIHRSTIVHMRKIKELQPCENGEYILTLKDGKQLSCSRGYSASLQQLVKTCFSI